MTKPTDKQLNYLKMLLRKEGLPDRYLGSWAKRFGLSMRERSGLIDELDASTVSRMIDQLKKGE